MSEVNRESEYTTVRLERDLVEQLQEKMRYGDTYNDYIRNKLGSDLE